MKIRKMTNRILAYTLTLAILLSTLVFGAVTSVSAEDAQVWDGSVATDFAGGDGSAATPYLIETAAQLRHMVLDYSTHEASNGKFFKLTKDIYLNDVADGISVVDLYGKKNWLDTSVITLPATSPTNSFSGTFDGNGHTVYGLYVNGAGGLFPAINSYTTIKNLNIENAFVHGGEGNSGALAGIAEYATWQNAANVTNCSVVNVTIGQAEDVKYGGGFIGYIESTTINFTNCYATGLNMSVATWVANNTPGAIVGAGESGGTLRMTNCYTTDYFVTSGGFARTSYTYTNVYTTAALPGNNNDTGVTVLTDAQMKGDAAKTNMSLDYRWNFKIQDNDYPTFQDEIIEVWDGSSRATSFDQFKGEGTAENPYKIENAAQLAYVVATKGLAKKKYYELVKDIRINDTTIPNWKEKAKNWVWEDFRFEGTVFEGNGHTIDGLFFNNYAKDKQGLFSYVGDTTIKNLYFTNASVTKTGGYGAGIVAGQTSASANFENIYIDETCEINAPTTQGVAAISSYSTTSAAVTVNITNCAVLATITGKSSVGAFLGYYNMDNDALNVKNSFSAVEGAALSGRKALKSVNNSYALVGDSYGTTVLTVDQMKGENAKDNMALSFKYIWEITDGYPVINIRGNLWNGDKSLTDHSSFKGSGTAADPYLIENGAQLYFAAIGNSNLADGSCYKLVNDIVLNDTSYDGWEASANTWGMNDKKRFNGTLDGDGHTIEGLYINVNSTSGRYALFSYIGKDSSAPEKIAEVKNIFFKGASINQSATMEGVGIVAGQTSGETLFENIYIDETSKVNAPNVTGVAGIAARGYNDNQKGFATIRNCAVLATITGKSRVGAFAGTYYANDAKVTIENSFAVTDIGLIGALDKGTVNITNTYTSTLGANDTGAIQVDAENMKGKNAEKYLKGFDFAGLWKTVENGYPVFRAAGDGIAPWGGAPADTSAISYAGGIGTKDDPYQIANGDQLYKMVAENSNADVTVAPETQNYFRITADINLGNKQWYTISVKNWLDNAAYNTLGFNGIIYGDGHTIYNLYSNVAAGAVGLIPIATQLAEIHDLHLKGGNLPRANYQTYAIGGLVGMAKGIERSKALTIEGCSVEDFTMEGQNGTGGLIGYIFSQSVNIKDCYVSNLTLAVRATSAANAGAFVGYIDGSEVGNSFVIENSYCGNENPVVVCRTDALKDVTTFKNVYTTNDAYDGSVAGLTKLSDAQMKGELDGFNYNQIWQTVENGYSVHLSFEVINTIWNGTMADNFAGGTGTKEDPFLVSDAQQLFKLANSSREETLGKFYKLTNNISISRVYSGWSSDYPYSWAVKKAYLEGYTYADSFAGTLDGAGYTVSGLYYNNEITDGGNYAYGMIPFATADAVVKNITVSDIDATVVGNGAAVGAVVGASHVTPEDVVNPLHMVQFVGVNVENCYTNAAYTGDILGRATYGVKFALCNADHLVGNYIDNIYMAGCNEGLEYSDDVLVYNPANIDASALSEIRAKIIGKSDKYIVDIDTVDNIEITDLVCACLAMNESAKSDEYALVWSQDFNNNVMDYSVWNTNTTMEQKSNLVYADNLTVTGGALKLGCKDTGETDANGKKIYSVNYGLSTLNTMSFKYGKIEMRAKIPFDAGAFPSLWLTSRNALGNGVSPYGYDNEIDIFEVFGKSSSQDAMVTCLHKWYVDEAGVRTGHECSCGSGILATGNGYKIEESDRSYNVSGSAKNTYHTIVFEWTEDEMIFSVDGNVYYTAKRSKMNNFDINGYDTNSDGLFNQFMYLRLNNHMHTVGGTRYVYGGDESEIDPSKLNYEIDYIKLYQKNDGKSEIILK